MTGRRLAVRPKELIYRSVLLLVLVCALTLSAVAWFVMHKMTRTGDMEVIMPPIIYIRDDKLNVMESFDLDGLQINETFYALFCVAPAYKGVVETFDVGVIYTENIGMVIDLFPVENITGTEVSGKQNQQRLLENKTFFFNYTESATTVEATYTNDRVAENNPGADPDNLNRGVHKMYRDQLFETNTPDETEILKKLNDRGAYRFYVLRVTWEPDISAAQLEKETDVVYIVTKGGTGKGEQTQ